MSFKIVCVILIQCIILGRTQDVKTPKYHFFRHHIPSNDEARFLQLFKPSKSVLVVLGPEISYASGRPTKPWSEWRGLDSKSIDTLAAFNKTPGLVWEYTHYRREVILAAEPNAAHKALVAYQEALRKEGKGREMKIFTHNIDSLQTRAGSKNVVEMEGSLFKTQCTVCGHEEENWDHPICPALKGRGSKIEGTYPEIPVKDLPHCKQPGCGGLLRPAVMFSDEKISRENLRKVGNEFTKTDFMIVIGVSCFGLKNPLAHVPPICNKMNHTIAEFSLAITYGPPHTSLANFLFEGPCTKTVPKLIKY